MTLRKSPTPPMGWNSWDCYGTTVTEAEVLANARFMARHLLPHGWDTVVIDADWADPGARAHGYNHDATLVIDEAGRLQPDPARFPSSTGGAGFAPLAAQLHALGLKLGLHVMRGIPRVAVTADTPIAGTDARASDVADDTNVCEWNPHYAGLDHGHPAAAAYYASCVAQYAEWGVDFIKADDMLWPYQATDIEAYSAAVARVDRDISLSLSPGRDLSAAHLDHLRDHATMWRVCDDVWDRWPDIVPNFARLARWAPLAGEAGWPDADMLPVGRIGLRAERGEPRDDLLTAHERRSLVTLWAMARSPLMIGGDLPSSAPATIGLLTNPGVLEVLRDSSENRELLREGDLVVWGAASDTARWAAVFHLGDEPASLVLDARALGLGPSPSAVVDVWNATALAVEPVGVQSDAARGVAPGSSAVRIDLEPHACALLRSER